MVKIIAQPLTLVLSGPANNAGPLYDYDKNNFQPRVAVAWSPSFGEDSSARCSAKTTSQYSVAALPSPTTTTASNSPSAFDLNNTLGFTSSDTIAANTFNLTTRPAPLFHRLWSDHQNVAANHDSGKHQLPAHAAVRHAIRRFNQRVSNRRWIQNSWRRSITPGTSLTNVSCRKVS